MKELISPHGGGPLQPLLLTGDALAEEKKRAEGLPRVPLSSREIGDLIMLGIGGFTPLKGFMSYGDWRGVCDEMRTEDGVFWPIPITLSCSEARGKDLKPGDEVALFDVVRDEIMGVMRIEERYRIDRQHECRTVFKTTDPDHPGVNMVLDQGEYNLGGPVKVFSQGGFPERFPGIYKTPAEIRELFKARGWQNVAAFQTRNPMHRSHEFLCKIAIELCDGVLVHSLLGAVKPGDIPADVRTRAINALIENHFVPGTVEQAGFPLDMRYAGPREALLHAVFRQNYGCTYLVVGRDHAGVGDYYGPFDAQAVFDEIPEDSLKIKPLKIDWTFWCHGCDGMASTKTCPHDPSERVLLSGSKVRKMLSEGEEITRHFSRPEVIEILREYYENLADEDRVEVKLSGHSAR